jgi:peroxiredoxin
MWSHDTRYDDAVTDLSPDFTLLDQARAPWTLSDHRGQAVVLLFLRGDW